MRKLSRTLGKYDITSARSKIRSRIKVDAINVRLQEEFRQQRRELLITDYWVQNPSHVQQLTT